MPPKKKHRSKPKPKKLKFGPEPTIAAPVTFELPPYVHLGSPLTIMLDAEKPIELTDFELRWSWLTIAGARGVVFEPQCLQTDAQRVTAPGPVTFQLESWRKVTGAAGRAHARNKESATDLDLDTPIFKCVEPPQMMLTICSNVGVVAKSMVRLLAPLAGPLKPTGSVATAAFRKRLAKLGAAYSMIVMGDDRWFVWFATKDGECVGEAELRALVSIRDEGIGRTFTNADLPRFAMHPAQPDERGGEIRPGSSAEARAWANQLVAAASDLDGLFPWLVSNTFMGMQRLRLQ